MLWAVEFRFQKLGKPPNASQASGVFVEKDIACC
jgi:hypothetical protein